MLQAEHKSEVEKLKYEFESELDRRLFQEKLDGNEMVGDLEGQVERLNQELMSVKVGGLAVVFQIFWPQTVAKIPKFREKSEKLEPNSLFQAKLHDSKPGKTDAAKTKRRNFSKSAEIQKSARKQTQRN